MNEAHLRFTDVFHAYKEGAGELEILKGANLEIRAGELVALVAPSGAGKSTLLRVLAGRQVPETGELRPGKDVRVAVFATGEAADAAREANIFHHLITLPTYHTTALSVDNLAKEYFGEQGMLGYVEGVQRKEIRQGIACVKHQNMSGSDMGDDHKEYFAGENALKAGGAKNTSNQFNNI